MPSVFREGDRERGEAAFRKYERNLQRKSKLADHVEQSVPQDIEISVSKEQSASSHSACSSSESVPRTENETAALPSQGDSFMEKEPVNIPEPVLVVPAENVTFLQ